MVPLTRPGGYSFSYEAHFPHRRYGQIARRASLPQVCALVSSGKSQRSSRPSRGDEEGRFGRSSRGVAAGSGGRRVRVRRSRIRRTAKSCGPGIPVLMPRSRCFDERCGRRGQERRSPGRSRISVKTIAQGRPDVRLVPVVLPRAFLLHADHGCDRHPAFPAPSPLRG
jgi:hypothetical protein